MSVERKYHHGQLRVALLEAAAEIVLESGADALTLRECARRVGVSHSAPLNHFPDRHSLLLALNERHWSEFADTLEAARVGVADPREALIAVGRAYIRFGRANRNLFDLMMRPDLKQTKAGAIPDGAVHSSGTLRESILASTTDHEKVDQYCAFAWSVVQGFIEVSQFYPEELITDEWLDSLLGLTLSGIR